MNTEEFDIIDELYFVTSFGDLESRLSMSIPMLLKHLKTLKSKQFIRIFDTQECVEELLNEHKINFEKCFFLASKKGLFEHNKN